MPSASSLNLAWNRLPCLTADLPGTGGIIRQTPEDFQVDERPAYAPCGSGTHQYVWIEKRGIDTNHAVRLLAKFLRRPERDFGVAGLKDKQACTRQYISIEHVPLERFAEFTDERLKIVSVTAHGNKLKVGHLKGNRFSIAVREPALSPDAAVARAQAILDRLETSGLPNFYGPQRFGREGANVARAYRKLAGRPLPETLSPHWGGLADVSALADPRPGSPLETFLQNSLQSALFNAVVAARLAAGSLGTLIPGDLAFLHRNGAVFSIADAAAATTEQPRATGKLFEISPSGPLFGRRMTAPTAAALAIEQSALQAWQLDDSHWQSPLMKHAPGARRPLRVPLENVALAALTDGYRVEFDLPAGSYATVVTNELIKPDAVAALDD